MLLSHAHAAASARLSGNITIAVDNSGASASVDVLADAATWQAAVLSLPGVGNTTTVTKSGDWDQGFKVTVGGAGAEPACGGACRVHSV
jgi:hypothetical protein